MKDAGGDAPARVGRYVILDRLGEGPLGTAYSAYDPELDRRIVVKVVRVEDDPGRADRLLLEAQAMARLQHPNVIQVYDVGGVDEGVFFAMERVEGGTLKEWMKQRHGWREVLGLFLQAGRGLAAAHAAGIVHRDFKPENVLIGKDGRVRVTDFGVAVVWETRNQGPARSERDRLALGAQLDGEVTAQTDQFSFCLALLEALQRPSVPGLFAAQANDRRAGKLEFPAGNPTPGFLREAVLRGLDANPGKRFPSMDALLRALAHDPRARRMRFAAVALLAGVALFAGARALAARASEARACRELAGRASLLWERSQPAIAKAFGSTGKPYAADVLRKVEGGLATFARDWGQARGEVCRGTAALPRAQLGAAGACLDQGGQILDEATRLLGKSDEAVVRNAALMVASLPPVRDCLDTDALASSPPPPADPAKAAAIAAARVRLARANILAIARPEDGIKEVRAMLAQLERQDYPAALAAAYFVLGEAENKANLSKEAEASLRRAAELATAGQDDRLFIKAASRMAYIVGGFHEQPVRAADWMGLARRSFERAGRPDALSGWLDLQDTGVQIGLGRWEECGQAAQRAAAAAARHGDVVSETEAVAQFAFCTRNVGTAEEAVSASQRVLERETATFGPEHPEAASTMLVLCRLHWLLGAAARALELCEKGLAATRAIGHPTVQLSLGLEEYGKVLSALGREAEALAARQEALALLDKVPQKRGSRPLIIAGLASSEHRLGKKAEAARHAREATSICTDDIEKVFQTNCAWARFVHAQVLFNRGARAEAQRQATRARDLYATMRYLQPLRERVEAWARTAGLPLPAGPR